MAKKTLKNHKPKLTKYVEAVQAGKTKTEAKSIAGYSPATTSVDIEKTEQFKALEVKLADKLDKYITKEQVAEKLANNILQEKEISGSNKAIEIYKDWKEPNGNAENTEDKVIIVIEQANINLNNKNATESQLEPPREVIEAEEAVIIEPKSPPQVK